MKCVFEKTEFTGGELRLCLEKQAGMLYKGVLSQPPHQSSGEMRWKLQQALEM